MNAENVRSPRSPRLQNWYINSYNDNEWTDLVKSDSEITGIVIANTTAGDLDVQVRIYDRNVAQVLGILLPVTTISAQTAKFLDFGQLAVSGNHRLQVQANAAGINFVATGVA